MSSLNVLIERRVEVILWSGLLLLGLLRRVVQEVAIVAVEVGITASLDKLELGVLSGNDELLSLRIPSWRPNVVI